MFSVIPKTLAAGTVQLSLGAKYTVSAPMREIVIGLLRMCGFTFATIASLEIYSQVDAERSMHRLVTKSLGLYSDQLDITNHLMTKSALLPLHPKPYSPAPVPMFDYRAELKRIGWQLAGMATVLASSYLLGFLYRTYFRSVVVSKTRRQPLMNPDNVRVTFNDLPPNESRPAKDHTHPEAAANRTGSSLFADRLARCLGKTAYFVQMSRSDTRLGRLGSREYYWSKDLTIEPRRLAIPENPLVTFIDVDEYVDMPNFLARNVHPTLIYTFQPDQVSKVASNYSYTFDKENKVTYNVTGGGSYTHPVWNYSSDHFVVSNRFCGIPYRTASYLVDRRSTAPDHELIMLTPVGHWNGLWAILFNWWIAGRPLTRLEPVTSDGFLRLQTSSLKGVMMSTGRVGNYNSATVPVATDDTISVISRTSSYDLTMPQVLSFTDGDRQAAAALLEYHRSATPGVKPNVVCPVPESTRRYQFDPRNFDPAAKPSLVGFMSPLVHDAFCPDKTVGNEAQMIDGRIEKVKPKELPLSTFLVQAMKEFAELLIPENLVHTLDPVDYDTVLDRQGKPTQRRILANSECSKPKRLIESFMKAEPYSNIKDPRVISTINGVDKREYSRYMYAFETVMKRQEWYAFAKTPAEIADRVVKICEECISQTTNSDFSRFDGHGSNVMRELEKVILMRAFRVSHHTELLELHKGQFGLKAFASFGTKYFTAFTRASGSPETSLFNTLVNAFVAFLALRMSKNTDGLFYTPEAAFRKLGVYGGDDGLTADLDAKIYQRAASSIGQELTVEPIRRGHGGVKFLARVYSPHVWFGDRNSCCDIPRQISKFHVSVRMPPNVTPQMKLLEKVRSFVLSDENTPIIGDLCVRVIGIHGDIKADERMTQLSSWLAQYDKTVQYPNSKAGWMHSYCEHSMPEFEYKRFTKWLGDCHTLEDILKSPMFQAPTPAKSSVPVVVDDQVLPLGSPIKDKPSGSKPNFQPKITTNTNNAMENKKGGEGKISADVGCTDTKNISAYASTSICATTPPAPLPSPVSAGKVKAKKTKVESEDGEMSVDDYYRNEYEPPRGIWRKRATAPK